MKIGNLLAGAVVTATLATSGLAKAATDALPAPIISENFQGYASDNADPCCYPYNSYNTTATTVGNFSSNLVGLSGESAINKASTFLYSKPSIFIQQSVAATGGNVNAVVYESTSISYNFELIGPSGFVPVKAFAKGGFSAGLTGLGTSVGIGDVFYVNQINGPEDIIDFSDEFGGNGNFAKYFNDSSVNLLAANTVYTVNISTEANISSIGNAGGGTAYVNTFIDPTFNIDPSFSNASSYQVEFSPGVGNVSAAPEPATWAMMLFGLCGIGAAMRFSRRSHVMAVAAA